MKKYLIGSLISCLTLTIMFGSSIVLGQNTEIIIDPVTKTIYISGGTNDNVQKDNFINTLIENQINSGNDNNIENIGNTNNTGGDEFELALQWMNTNGLTKFNTKSGYKADNPITREEASKMISQAYKVLGYPQNIINNNCIFDDANTINPELKVFVDNVCGLGLIKGGNKLFNPQKTMTKPEIMAVLIRILEQKSSNENQTKRRTDYYLKAKAIGLTKDDNINNFDNLVTRYEVAILINRLKNIVSNSQIKQEKLAIITNINNGNTGNNNTNNNTNIGNNNLNNNTNTGNISNNNTTNNTGIVNDIININNNPELTEAINWMYDNGLTKFNTTEGYDPLGIVTRSVAAKILDIFTDTIGIKNNNSESNCTFKDISKVDPGLKINIENICKKGVMKGGNGLFSPYDKVSKAQFIVSLMRIYEGKKLDETSNPRWKNYFDKALNMGIVSASSIINFDKEISRYEVAILIQKMKTKYLILRNLNQVKNEEEIISTVSGSISTINNKIKANVYVETNLLGNTSLQGGYMELLGTRYRLEKTTVVKDNIGDNSFVRYGNIIDLEEDSKVGTINFTIGNGYLIKGIIRLNNKGTFEIKISPDTNTYFILNQI